MTFVKHAGHTSIYGAGNSVIKAAAPFLLRLKGGGRSKEKVQTLDVEEASFGYRDDPSTETMYHRNALDVGTCLEGTRVPDAGGGIQMQTICSRRFLKRLLVRERKTKKQSCSHYSNVCYMRGAMLDLRQRSR